MKKTTIALFLAVIAILTMCVSAEEVLPSNITDTALQIEGKDRITVTSSVSSDSKLKTGLLFDADTDTALEIDLTDAENKTFSVYTSSQVPQALATLGVILDLGDAEAKIDVYATNDSLRQEWTKLTLSDKTETIGKYTVINVSSSSAKYTFYRIDFTLTSGDKFSISEMRLFKIHTDEPDMIYDIGSSVEAGETPALIPADSSGSKGESSKTDKNVLPNAFYLGWFYFGNNLSLR